MSFTGREMNGKVKWFSHKKGYGFIIPESGGDDVFVHIAEVLEADDLNPNDPVKYEIGPNRKTGKSEAKSVRLA